MAGSANGSPVTAQQEAVGPQFRDVRHGVEGAAAESLADRYFRVRRWSEFLAEGLSAEDCVVQSMPDASPVKWHLAHTTWFYETFLLQAADPGRRPFAERFSYLFNSYYNAVGSRHPRAQRGLLTRPSLEEVFEYRAAVDAEMSEFLESPRGSELRPVLEIGLQHEQQHQELILTDVKHLLSCNPLQPAFGKAGGSHRGGALPCRSAGDGNAEQGREWCGFPAGLYDIGYEGEGFSYDNEQPRHRVYVHAFSLAKRPVTCGEYLAFVEAGGYQDPAYWLSDGWETVCREQWQAPLYWERLESGWHVFTLNGPRPLDFAEPVCHVSLYEADAYARWAGCRLPTEAEWETAAAGVPVTGHFAEDRWWHPAAAGPPRGAEGDGLKEPALEQLFGDVWEWTASPYVAYPGYRPAAGALGEYNGKFMSGQMVLRGGSCGTPASHIRSTYRNFFTPAARWQFSGLRLARDGM